MTGDTFLPLTLCTWNAMDLFPGKFGRTDFHQRSFGGSLTWWPGGRWNLTGRFHRPPGGPLGGRDSRLIFFPLRYTLQNQLSYYIHYCCFFNLKNCSIAPFTVIVQGILPSTNREWKWIGESTSVNLSIKQNTFIYLISFFP